MRTKRRSLLYLGGTGIVTAVAGCFSFPPQEYTPVTIENQDGSQHAVTIGITSVPSRHSGFTTYFSETWHLDSGEEHSFGEGLAVGDYEPEVMALVVLDDETTKRTEFTFEFDLTEVRVLITDEGQINVQPRS